MFKLVLLRHGESEWNLENRFSGWADIGLTEKGMSEAKRSGLLLKGQNFRFDVVFTSVLKRAIKTMEICLSEMGSIDIPTIHDWLLIEQHYGALQGLSKTKTAEKYGEKQVFIWRRSYRVSPPALDLNDKRHPRFDQRYRGLGEHQLPSTESLKDTLHRLLPLWNESIEPSIKSGKKVLIVAHGNSLRALVKHLNGISDDEIKDLNIPTGVPYVFELDAQLKSQKNYYLK